MSLGKNDHTVVRSDDVRLTAVHEAGHIVCLLLKGHVPLRATIRLSTASHNLGSVGIVPRTFDAESESAVEFLVSGLAAEQEYKALYGGEAHSDLDFEVAREKAESLLGSDDAADEFVSREFARAKVRFRKPEIWKATELIALRLLELGTLQGNDMADTCREALAAMGRDSDRLWLYKGYDELSKHMSPSVVRADLERAARSEPIFLPTFYIAVACFVLVMLFHI